MCMKLTVELQNMQKKKKLIELKGEIDKSTIVGEDLKVPLFDNL